MVPSSQPTIHAICYSRCSTTEARQDVENQLKELRRYCTAYGWSWDEVAEYDSGYKGEQPKLQEVLANVRKKRYQVFAVFSLDRFSRQHPARVNALLDSIVYHAGCRFISLQDGLDSSNDMTWCIVKPLLTWAANTFSKNLSEKIRLGIQTKKAKGTYRGGRPRKAIDLERLRQIRLSHPDYGWRRLSHAYNDDLPTREQVSLSLLRKVCKNLAFSQANGHPTDGPQNSEREMGVGPAQQTTPS